LVQEVKGPVADPAVEDDFRLLIQNSTFKIHDQDSGGGI
jgi:hypothetical protein